VADATVRAEKWSSFGTARRVFEKRQLAPAPWLGAVELLSMGGHWPRQLPGSEAA